MMTRIAAALANERPALLLMAPWNAARLNLKSLKTIALANQNVQSILRFRGVPVRTKEPETDICPFC
jgi:hypothetical protein